MRALQVEDPQAQFRYFGGDKMQAEGGTLVKHYADMAFMGFTEVLLHLRTILRNMKTCKADVLAYQPDVLILIDFPGFNLKIADFAKAAGIRVAYYISPKVWAWNQKRVLRIKKVVDQMFCILPFEVNFYAEWGMPVHYVGNPLLDEIAAFVPDKHFREEQKSLIALLPGSRRQEIERLLPVMLETVDRFPDYQFVVAAAPTFDAAYYQQFIGERPVKLVFSKTYDLLANAHAALVASGTATLETALFKVPQVVVYKGGALSIAIARLVVKIKYISLVNLIMDEQVVTELIQQDCNPATIAHELGRVLAGEGRTRMLAQYARLHDKMGDAGASARTARLIVAGLH